MELMLFRTFQVVVEAGSFTAAAERLCISQSAVSRRIKHLEDHYDTELVDRSSEPTSPTQAGMLVLQKARRILSIEDEMETEVARLAQRKRIGFCCTSSFGTGTLPGVFERFLATHAMVGDLNINFLMPEEIVSGLNRGEYEFAVVEHCDAFEPGDLPHFELPPDTMLFVSAPSLGLDSESLTLDDLADWPLLLKTPDGCAYRFLQSKMAAAGRDLDDLPRITFYDDLPGLIRQVKAGAGLGFLSQTLIKEEVEQGQLRVHAVPDLGNQRDRTLFLAPGETVGALVQDFASAIFAELKVPFPDGFLPLG